MTHDPIATRIDLAGEWLFRTDPRDIGLPERWFEPQTATRGWRSVHMPANWEFLRVEDYDGAGWYRRAFEAYAAQDGRRLGIGIRGVDQSVAVWVNGRQITPRVASQRCFGFDVDDVVTPGQNTIAIRLFDTGGPGGLIGSMHLQEYTNAEELLVGKYAGVAARPSAEWVRDAVIYEVYLRSFSPKGSFEGLEERLDELQALGVTVIWLMPIHPLGRKHRKGPLGSPYAVRDFHAVNPEFGTMDDFASLLRAVHARGMKLIIDLVANHTAFDNPLIGTHPAWFAHDKHGAIRSPNPDWTDVAQLDHANADLRAWMIEMMRFWVRQVGIDGFRCDVADLLPTDFWNDARAALEPLNPADWLKPVKSLMMLAEGDRPDQHLRAFDLTYDWKTYDQLGRLASGKLRPRDIAAVLADERLLYPLGSLRLRFSTNHDKNAWDAPAIERYGPQAARAAAVLTFTLPGVPLIYNGQEVGNPAPLGLFDRTPIDWHADPHRLRALYTQLAGLRAEHAPLRRGKCRFVELADTPQVPESTPQAPESAPRVLAFTRATSDERVVVLINLREAPAIVRPSEVRLDPTQAHLASTDTQRQPAGILLPPFGFWIGPA